MDFNLEEEFEKAKKNLEVGSLNNVGGAEEITGTYYIVDLYVPEVLLKKAYTHAVQIGCDPSDILALIIKSSKTNLTNLEFYTEDNEPEDYPHTAASFILKET